MFDWGLLALRGAGFLLAFTFGLQKIGWYIAAFHSDKSFSSIGLAPLIAQVGFPAPVILALWITFNESIGALFLGFGLFTRVLAASAALGMAGALYTSVRLGEDWLRAALYLDCLHRLVSYRPRQTLSRPNFANQKNKSVRAAPPKSNHNLVATSTPHRNYSQVRMGLCT
jgi:uncharacterized membrane protein YphA (DoxX/SURF4 family)